MKLLVCGDRNWSSRMIIREYLKYLKPELVIEGGARGADILARIEARSLGIEVMEVPAEWHRFGGGAGPIRNGLMLDLEPDLVVAFHRCIEDSSGTVNMLCQAEERGVLYFLVG